MNTLVTTDILSEEVPEVSGLQEKELDHRKSGGFFHEAEYISAARKRAIEILGENWVLHPNYKYNKKHSNELSTWWPHRTLRHDNNSVNTN